MRLNFIVTFFIIFGLGFHCSQAYGAEHKMTPDEKERLKQCYPCLSKADLTEYFSLNETVGFGISPERESWLGLHCSQEVCDPSITAFTKCSTADESKLGEFQKIENREDRLFWLSQNCGESMKLFFKCHESLSIEDQNYFLSTPNEMKPQLLKTLCPKIIKSTKAIQAKPKNENAYNSSTYQPPRAPRHYGIVAHALIWPGLLLGSASLTFGIVTVHSGDEVFSNMDDTSRAIMATTYFVTAGLHFVAMFAGIGLALRQKQVNEEFSLNKKKIALKVPSIFIGQNSVMLDCGFNF